MMLVFSLAQLGSAKSILVLIKPRIHHRTPRKAHQPLIGVLLCVRGTIRSVWWPRRDARNVCR